MPMSTLYQSIQFLYKTLYVTFHLEREGRKNQIPEDEYEIEAYEDYYEPEYYFEDYGKKKRKRRETESKSSSWKRWKKEKTAPDSTKTKRKIERSKI